MFTVLLRERDKEKTSFAGIFCAIGVYEACKVVAYKCWPRKRSGVYAYFFIFYREKSRVMKRFFLGVCVVFSSFFVAFSASGAERDTVFVSIAPQKYFVEQICGKNCAVEVMVQPGASPATYEPKPSQMRKLKAAKLYFAVGVPFERVWLDKIAQVNKEMRVIHTEQGISRMAMPTHYHHDEEHKAEHHEVEHDVDHKTGQQRAGLDPHIWLAPSLVKIQAETIAQALIEQYPDHKVVFEKNLGDFLQKISDLDLNIKAAFQGMAGREFMVFHPSWGYWARDYGLVQVPVEIEGKNPKPAQLQALIEHAQEHHIKVVFAQPQFSAKSAEMIAAAIKGKVIMIDPLAEDWMENLKKIALIFLAAI